jgi:hypothetical protein
MSSKIGIWSCQTAQNLSSAKGSLRRKWVLKKKIDVAGNIPIYKGRLVMKGF